METEREWKEESQLGSKESQELVLPPRVGSLEWKGSKNMEIQQAWVVR